MAAVAGVFHILNHCAFKAALFMSAGIVDHEAGTRDMRLLGGLWPLMPITGTVETFFGDFELDQMTVTFKLLPGLIADTLQGFLRAQLVGSRQPRGGGAVAATQIAGQRQLPADDMGKSFEAHARRTPVLGPGRAVTPQAPRALGLR